MQRRNVGNREVLLEFHRLGDYVRVSAIDPVSNTEITLVGSRRASERELTRLAVRKLDYVLAKKFTAQKRPGKRRPARRGTGGDGILA